MASAGDSNVLLPLGADTAIGTPFAFPDKLITENDAEQEIPSGVSDILTPGSTPLSAPRGSTSGSKASAKKPKRVRTGCLTCRERHLKCDEALHRCHNCRKAGRICRRGIRLNFIDTQISAPPHYIKPPLWNPVSICDESRRIASEYVGGFERYPTPEKDILLGGDLHSFPYFGGPVELNTTDQPVYRAVQSLGSLETTFQQHSHATTPSNEYYQNSTLSPFRSTSQKAINAVNHTCLQTLDETLLLQTFVEEVGPWMDSMNAANYFSHILPFYALEEPMLLQAVMACAARHLSRVNSSYGEEQAVHFHDMAYKDLLRSLRDPARDSALCATTAVILNVYEAMCSGSMVFVYGMDHIAGARALIKECHWDATTPGLGGACFWLNVEMELLDCLHSKWIISWDPDLWGVDMNMHQARPSIAGNEEAWAHRMVYICAKVSNFRSSSLQVQADGYMGHEPELSHRYQEWCTYNAWCNQWAQLAPRSMMPLSYVQPWQANSNSAFPKIWLVKHPIIIARLFYHTTRILLSKSHPLESEFSPEMQSMQQSHSHDICGIVAHVRDRGIAGLSTRFLAIVAESFKTRETQEETLKILDDIAMKTGYSTESIKHELQEVWGWNSAGCSSIETPSNFTSSDSYGPVYTQLKMPPGIINPIMACADFSMDNHPYQGYYVAPHESNQHSCGF
ncbi:hypothetical protein P168DRAFT_311278 [Aspergillus campestris IBT 28561]|uniref:Zn(2)-C6 fungal-type domain-containing protein n=1 Tax=Aspergillus campestris (strain IBT 28561) TaxID=1392248 RepID=A0A2I1D1H3_ASPC2|nr:uncharacterized protein P168DRAFT_311278 [Aspergillus campestris IBT 28561]PKY03716.1 hypothetical protein P168DRAFT_311278 [Aspergillus campestris IBT 28561]